MKEYIGDFETIKLMFIRGIKNKESLDLPYYKSKDQCTIQEFIEDGCFAVEMSYEDEPHENIEIKNLKLRLYI